MGQLKSSLAFLSWLMYRDYSLFISYSLLYITNIMHSCVYSDLFPLHDIVIASALISLIFIYLLSDVFIVLLSYISFPNGISHRVDVLTQDRCVGIPHSNLLYHAFSGMPVLDQSPYVDGRSSTALIFVLVDDISSKWTWPG